MFSKRGVLGVVIASAILYHVAFYEFQMMNIGDIPEELHNELLKLNSTCKNEWVRMTSRRYVYAHDTFSRYACVLRDATSPLFLSVEKFFAFRPSVCFYVLSRNYRWFAYGSHEDTSVVFVLRNNYTFCHYNFYNVMTQSRETIESITEDPRSAHYFFAVDPDQRLANNHTATCANVPAGKYVHHNARHFHHTIGDPHLYTHRVFCETHNTLPLRLRMAAQQLWSTASSYFRAFWATHESFGAPATLDLRYHSETPP